MIMQMQTNSQQYNTNFQAHATDWDDSSHNNGKNNNNAMAWDGWCFATARGRSPLTSASEGIEEEECRDGELQRDGIRMRWTGEAQTYDVTTIDINLK